MNELVIKGKKYISSKRASDLTGYAKDYVGQLVRMGKLPAERVGRAWYVEEAALLAHSGTEATRSSVGGLESGHKKSLTLLQGGAYDLPKTWEKINYLADSADLFPILSETKKQEAPIVEDSETVRVPTKVVRTHDLQVTHFFDGVDSKKDKENTSRISEKDINKGSFRRDKQYKSTSIIKKIVGPSVVFVSIAVLVTSLSGIFLPLEIKSGSEETASAFLASNYAKDLSQASFSAISGMFYALSVSLKSISK